MNSNLAQAKTVEDAITAIIPLRRADPSRSLGRIDIHHDPQPAEAAWAELEALAPASIYQTRRFLQPWMDTYGRENGILPMIVVAHDKVGRPVALLPFGIRRHGPMVLAEFLGGSDSNANVGLFHPEAAFTAADLRSLLHAAAARSQLKPDLFLLVNQPQVWERLENPLDIFPHQASASFLHGTTLEADGRAFVARHLPGDKGKKLRKKERKLAGWGPIAHRVASNPLEVAAFLDVFFAQKLERFRRKGIESSFSSHGSRAFLERTALEGLETGTPTIELHALFAGERIVAIFGGGSHRGHFHAMFNSFDLDEEIGKTSPGDLLLKSLIEAKCNEGLQGFDLGIGEARYKTTWCKDPMPLFDSILPVTGFGHLYMLTESTRRHIKRWIKQSDWAWPLVQKLIGRA